MHQPSIQQIQRLALTALLAGSPSAFGDVIPGMTVPINHADGPVCPVGILSCPKRGLDWSLCKSNDMLGFFVPDLPTTGDRSLATTDIDSVHAESTDGETYMLDGDARIQRLDQLIRADKFSYNRTTTDWMADGNVRYQDRSMLMSAIQAHGTTDPSHSELDQARYQLLSSRGNGAALRVVTDDMNRSTLTRATFTTCDLDDTQWEIRARDLVLDQEEGVGRGHDVTFRVHDVPILWLPYARFPLDDRRLSGFLYPDFGYSNRRGVDITIPYYLNLAPNYDATIDARLMTHRGVMLGGEFRYLLDNSRGTFDGTWLPNDRESDIDRGFVHWDNETRLSPNWGVSVDINHVSDDQYFQDFGRGLNTSSISLLPSSVYLQGRGTWWKASIGGDEYQISDPSISQRNEPYRRLPRVLFSAEHDVLGDLQAGVNSEYVDFTKDNGLDGRRLDLFPYLSLPIETSSYFVRPQLGYRYTSYDIDRASDRTPTRGVPIFDLDAGLIFEREITLGDGEYTQTLEPRIFYLRVPYRDQSNLPDFDTQLVPFSFGQLFRTNAFVGADRQINANNLTLAMTSRLLENASGDEIVSASIGQIRYFDDQLVQLGSRPATDFSGSAYVAGLDLHLNSRWRVSLDQQWNPNTHQTDLSTAQLQHRFGDDGAINLSYRYRRGYLEQADISALIPITRSWRLIGRDTYSLLDSRTLERFFGIEHDTCCVTWRALTRRWIRSVAGELDAKSDSALYFEVEFKGIGATGEQAENFLRRSVLGYR